ncbi:hypothetical protein SAMN05518865_10440 [Duganella sp. CF458]|uniref:hypothetical protein n=1 Tax=Duganella sp. CF458 TaxID=1884368 RepID=UPI0008EAF4D8|nr:hypothetical protein [Duganella sp. CF458]SFF73927.1 hypothetical protein SAMN05518865_10440 [Duganella sp. CF458]
MSLVDIHPLPAEDEIMDPATKQYVDSNLAITEGRSDARLAEFRSTIEAYTARADEREAAAREREAAARERDALRAKALEQRMRDIVEREAIRAEAFEQRMDGYEARADERQRATEARFDRIEASIASLKKLVVGASLSTVLGVGAIYLALVQNYHAAFDSARYRTTAERDMAAQRQRTEALLTAIDARLAALQKAGGQQAPLP